MDEITIHQLSRIDIERGLAADKLRLAQILQLALTAGPLVFLGVIFLVRAKAAPAEAAADSPTRMLLLALGPMALGSYLAAAFFANVQFAPRKLRSVLPERDDLAGWVGALMAQFQTWLIIRMALLEGASIFGLVIVLLGVTDGSLAEQPILWLGLIPTGIQVLVAAATFPNRRNLAQFLDQKLVRPLQRA